MAQTYNITKMSEINPKAIAEIKKLATNLFVKNALNRDEQIEEITLLVSQHLNMIPDSRRFEAIIAVFFDAVFKVLQRKKKHRDGELYKFFVLTNHLPVLENSAFFAQTLAVLSAYFRKDASTIKLFDRLQLLYLYVEIKHFSAANALAQELEQEIEESNLSFYALYYICRFQIMNATSNVEEKMRILLTLTVEVFEAQGEEVALFLMVKWLNNLEIIKNTVYYKALLMNLYQHIREHKNINSAMVGYELFSMDDKIISPEQKMEFYKDLIDFNENILNAEQLHALHFFAGNYMSGLDENLRESIQSYKSSNYFLHKCWERLIGISKYLRMHSKPNDYKNSISYLDKLYLNLSHQTSMRNNSYVENLQMNYDKIEELYQEVGELSLRDSLTGLRNRRYMENNLTQIVALSFRHKASVSFAMLDIDYFKRVNDIYGHAAGDSVLRDLGTILESAFRKSDIIIRYGGEEFLVVLFDVSMQRSKKMMQDLRQQIENKTFQYKNNKIKITISIGLSCEQFSTSADCCELQRFVQNADAALYKAKEKGRNRVEVYRKNKNPA
ncbi:MAG: GGDEF domain-containing protein [Candidatus Cloacimonadaceae bacterium]|jgi:diguanylate cyclase (GGDEF)-like protein|nr:GGDEF domain-containing protein [Candidatus Cloacimonadaceae bacterium]